MTIALSEALALVERRCVPATGAEDVGLAGADGRVLAEDIVAPIDVPAADNSAVDGYAVRHSGDGVGHQTKFALVGVSAAGRPFDRPLEPGEAVRIFTGALPPDGADAIAMQEEVERDGGLIRLSTQLPRQANIRRSGEDIAAGATVFAAGRRLGPVEIGMLASLGIATIAVRRRLRVALMSAGDELIEAGQGRRPGSNYDANRPTLLALLARLGVDVTDLGILPDRQDAIAVVLASAAAGHDAIVSSAGVSIGDEDHMRAAAGSLGALDFSGVAIKPGKPVAFGHISGIPFFALPGNPVAMLICFLMIARPGLLRLAGADRPPARRFPAEPGFSMRRKPGRCEFVRCTLHLGGDRPVARRFGRGGAAILSSIAGSDGLLEVTEEIGDVAPGMVLPFIPFSEFGI